MRRTTHRNIRTSKPSTWVLFDDSSVFSEAWVDGKHYLYAGKTGNLPLGRFVHIALTHSDKDHLYVDGVPGVEGIVTPGLQRAATNVPLLLGSFVGCVDELAIYDKELAPARIASHVTARVSEN